MSNYTKSTNFATKDNLTPGDPLKIVRGTEIDTEFNNIATAIATKTDNASAAITGGTINDTTIGATTASTGAFTTLAASGNVTLSGGTANGVAYLNGSKVVTSGSALTFDGTSLGVGTSSPAYKLDVIGVLGSGNGTITSGFSYDTGGLVGTFSNHALGVLTNGNVVAKFDTSGNLGLGVTPSAWAGGYKAIQVAGSSSAAFSGDTASAHVTTNTYFDGTNWKYLTTTSATDYYQYLGQHVWRTAASGTAGDAITFTQAMTLDASGRLLVGLTSGTSGYNIEAQAGASGTGIRASNSGGGNISIEAESNATSNGVIRWTNDLKFISGSERARIDSSGNLLVGQTSVGFSNTDSVYISPSIGSFVGQHASGTVSGTGYAIFTYSGGQIGSITQNGTTAVAYNTSSDYRLKNTIAPMTGALAKVAQLKPVTYKWNADGSNGQGFIAHELAEVCPDAVTGEKDAVDAQGNPQYQGIDVSFLVATLTAAIKEQQAIIESLKARLDAANL